MPSAEHGPAGPVLSSVYSLNTVCLAPFTSTTLTRVHLKFIISEEIQHTGGLGSGILNVRHSPCALETQHLEGAASWNLSTNRNSSLGTHTTRTLVGCPLQKIEPLKLRVAHLLLCHASLGCMYLPRIHGLKPSPPVSTSAVGSVPPGADKVKRLSFHE